jgi:hypothetical protein
MTWLLCRLFDHRWASGDEKYPDYCERCGYVDCEDVAWWAENAEDAE